MTPPLELGPPGRSGLPRCEVYLARLAQLQAGHRDLLNGPETERALRMRRRASRDLFVLATALLRLAVGRHESLNAGDVVLDRSCELCGSQQHGRPRLPGTGLEASISHSGDLVAVALTNGRPVGVDVEIIGTREYESLVESVCALAERPGIGSAADFYTYWTRKEAVLKATAGACGYRSVLSS
jgi:4'-phosphopantetheinyl transferase